MRFLGASFAGGMDRRKEKPEPAPPPSQAERLVTSFEAQGSGWFWETDRDGKITYLSAKVARQIEETGRAVIGRALPATFEMAGASENAERTLIFHLSARASFEDYEVRLVGKDDERSWSISGRPWFDELGQFRGFVGSGCDLTQKRRSEAEISRLAMFDSLTGLANRDRMNASLGQALQRSSASYRPTGLLLLDLDRFKAVNDTLGHQTGDLLLQQVAQRLKRAVGDKGLVGRLGGDEFKVILPGVSNHERLAELSGTIITSISQPYFISGANVTIGCSIGVSVAPEHGDDPETLVRNADLALYAAKADGRGVHRFYCEELLLQAQTRKLLEDDLRHAMGLDQLRLVYQPVVSTASGQIVGYEALLRWDHPARGAISPSEFIPVAEDAGLINQLGEWVLRTACDEAARWPNSVRVAVNVSPIQFAKSSFPATVASALAATGLDPQRLELEITESVFVNGGESTDRMFQSLKTLGVRLALDDFGTGYSSLGYLRTAPFDKIKIDQSFVRGAKMPGNRNAAIIKAIVTLAESLEMETTAEGVEAQDEIELIRELGCSHIQGFVYGKPVPASEITHHLSGDRCPTPVGIKVTRVPRTTTLRRTSIRVGSAVGSAYVRNMSQGGVMIDRISGIELTVEMDLTLEIDGKLRDANVRWMKDGRAGLSLE